MVVTLGQPYNVGEKPTVILYIVNRHARTSNNCSEGPGTFRFFFKKTKTRGTVSLDCSSICYFRSRIGHGFKEKLFFSH